MPISSSSPGDLEARIATWLEALDARHRLGAGLSSREFLKALRALSARYVERRAELPDRSPIDSAAKRAAFAAFYGPLHFIITRAVVAALGAADASLEVIIDLGCGTGVASAAWALTLPALPRITGVDRDAWVVDEASRTWRDLGLDGRARRSDMTTAIAGRDAASRRRAGRRGVVAGWSVNELDGPSRARLLTALLSVADRGDAVLVIEPIARRVSPWWHEWSTAFTARGGRDDDWTFDVPLPPTVAQLDEAAGFDRQRGLTARSLWLSA